MKKENTESKWAETKLRELGQKIDDLIDRWKNADGEVKEEFQSRINELKRNKEKLKKDFEEFTEKNKPRFQEAADRLEEAGREIKKAFDALMK
jgi:uncharacterized protein YukE